MICVVSLFIALPFVLPDNYAQSCSPIRSAAPLFLTSACLAGAPSSGIADSATSETANRAVKLLQVTLLSYFSHLHFRYSTSKPTASYYNTKPTCQELIFGWSQACGYFPLRTTDDQRSRIYQHPLCWRSHAELCPIDLLQFLLRPDLDIYFGNKKTAKTKQPIDFKQSQPNEYSFIKNKFPL